MKLVKLSLAMLLSLSLYSLNSGAQTLVLH